MAKKIMIVDDSSTMRKIVMRSLRQAGLEFASILEAGNGVEALATLQQESVDLILSDINMPEMDGLEFLRQKSTDESIKSIPVVMITTEGGSDILGEAKSLGAVGTLKKPFTPEQINQVLTPLV